MQSEPFEVSNIFLSISLSCTLFKSEWMIILSLKGDLGVYSDARFNSLITLLFSVSKASIIIDLTRTYLDLTGLSLLVQLHEKCKNESIRLVLAVKSNSANQELIDLAKLSQYFSIYEDMPSAIESFKPEFRTFYSNESDKDFELQASRIASQLDQEMRRLYGDSRNKNAQRLKSDPATLIKNLKNDKAFTSKKSSEPGVQESHDNLKESINLVPHADQSSTFWSELIKGKRPFAGLVINLIVWIPCLFVFFLIRHINVTDQSGTYILRFKDGAVWEFETDRDNQIIRRKEYQYYFPPSP